MGISILFSFAFHFSPFLSYLEGLLGQLFLLFAFVVLRDGFDHRLLSNVIVLLALYQIYSLESICYFHYIVRRDLS